jgi:oxygen-dependent protoporphyrinogen oxidase
MTAAWQADGMSTRAPHVVVVGAGIAGLSAAWALTAARGVGLTRARVSVLEGGPRIGGALRTANLDGVEVDVGAEALLARRTEAVALARAVGLGADLVQPATAQASIWSRGALRALPSGTLLGIPGDLRALAASGVLSLAELARVPLDHYLPGGALDHDVAVGSWVGRRVGHAVVDRLVEPLLGGVYAGRADQLSLEMALPRLFAVARSEPSLLAAVRAVQAASPPHLAGEPMFVGIRGGVGRLPAAVAAAVTKHPRARLRTAATVRALARTPTGWRLTVGSAHAPELLHADAVILAVPGPPAARLLADLVPAAAAELALLDYASVVLVTLVLPGDAIPTAVRGSGFLVPPVERRLAKAATFSSRKWAWSAQAAGGRTVVRVSVGRAGESRDVHREDTELVALARRELAAAAGVSGVPLAAEVTRWGGSLPQYAPGHRELVERLRASLRRHPTLALCGAAYDGVGVPACVASGTAAGARVAAALAPATRPARGSARSS